MHNTGVPSGIVIYSRAPAGKLIHVTPMCDPCGLKIHRWTPFGLAGRSKAVHRLMFRGRRQGAFKYQFNVHVHDVTLRDGVAADAWFHLMMKKGDRVATTQKAEAAAGPSVPSPNLTGVKVPFDEILTLVCTMYRDSTRGAKFAHKEATFTLLHGRAGKATSSARPLGRARIDLADHAGLDTTNAELSLVLLHDAVPVGDLRLTVSSRWLRNFGRGG